ncbi:hypothetical protein GWK47_023391 [Chionoecetes opilio]|uniref:Uncharacterized protein n=1 Tax=Chionoecetes opilio TaxID=41210 RepID=A0A8J5CGI3_CHIOP|nr:hypothetical protein GWK47_023391 [Chionoecetes opilio]
MPRISRCRKAPRVAGHDNLKIKSHVTRNEDETAAGYESQTHSALESSSTAGSGSQSKEEAGSEAPLPLTTGKGKRHGDLLSHRFSQSEKNSELTISNGSSSCHDSAVSSCDGISSCSSPSLEAFSLESGCVDFSDSSSCASPGQLGRKNSRRRRQRKYKKLMLRIKREMANPNVQGTNGGTSSEEAAAEVSEVVAQCTATPAVTKVDGGETVTIINDNLQDLNCQENLPLVDCITSPDEINDILIYELETFKEETDASACDSPSRVTGPTSDEQEDGNDIHGGLQEEEVMDPSVKLELVDVLKAEQEDEGDIAIYEVKSNALVESEEYDENEMQSGDGSLVIDETDEEECPVIKDVTEQQVETVSPDAAGKTVQGYVDKIEI